MKLVISTLIILLAAAGIAHYAQEDPGYVMISIRDITLETSVTLMVAVLLASFTIFYGAMRLGLQLTPYGLRRMGKRRSANTSRKLLNKGMMKLQLGQWHHAEKLLIKAARNQEVASLAYIGAARAAEGLGIAARRDGYIKLAQKNEPKNELPLTLALAQTQSDFAHTEQALATLDRMPLTQQQHPAALKLKCKLLTDAKDWPRLVALLPKLERGKVYPQAEFYRIEHLAYSGLINHIARNKDAKALWEAWRKLPKRLQAQEDLLVDFACSMINFGQSDQVAEVLYQRIGKQWSDSLIYIYGLLDGDAEIHVTRARKWLAKHGENPAFLLSMGRLAMRAHQWKNAREYLQKSLQITPNAESYQELGNLLAFLDEQPQALECYRRGLALTNESLIQPEIKSGEVEHASLPRSPIHLAGTLENRSETEAA